jgi:biopolymer transport protein ExbB
MSPIEVIEKGGPVMFILVFVSIYCLSLILIKLYQFYESGAYNEDKVKEAIHGFRQGEPESILLTIRHPILPLMPTCIKCGKSETMHADQIHSEISRVGSQIIREMESYLRGLSGIAHISPLLGLLGTVLGMIQAFYQLQESGSKIDPALLAEGIWSALLTTAYGLAIAIPAMSSLYYLEGIVDRVRATMKDASIQILTHYGKV